MLEFIIDIFTVFESTIRDVAPIILLIGFFQIMIIKKNIPDIRRVFLGVIFVVLGLSFFLIGLQKALFPLGDMMAKQLVDIDFIRKGSFTEDISWTSYYWIYIFAALIGFTTTIAEPALKAVAYKANEASGGTISQKGLRIVVAIGVGTALAVGTFRIVSGTPLHYYIMAGYIIVMIQTYFAPKDMVALAYDSGGVSTSTVSVPIIAAIGLGVSASIPGRNPAIEGFGLIAIAVMFPVITVLAYAKAMEMLEKYRRTEI